MPCMPRRARQLERVSSVSSLKSFTVTEPASVRLQRTQTIRLSHGACGGARPRGAAVSRAATDDADAPAAASALRGLLVELVSKLDRPLPEQQPSARLALAGRHGQRGERRYTLGAGLRRGPAAPGLNARTGSGPSTSPGAPQGGVPPDSRAAGSRAAIRCASMHTPTRTTRSAYSPLVQPV